MAEEGQGVDTLPGRARGGEHGRAGRGGGVGASKREGRGEKTGVLSSSSLSRQEEEREESSKLGGSVESPS